MFQIDLLLGSERPPRSHPLWIAGLTLLFAAVAVAAALDVVQYLHHSQSLAAQERALAHYRTEIASMADTQKMLDANRQRRATIDAGLAEVSKVLGTHRPWSDILSSLAETAPNDLTILDLQTRREPRKGQAAGQKTVYDYTLTMGMVSLGGPAVVEQFIRQLRTTLPLMPGSDSIRITSQRHQQVAGRDLQYYVVECRLKP